MTDPYYADATVRIFHGDCLDVLRELPDASVDAVVTDPPYGLEFMGKEWDRFGPGTIEPKPVPFPERREGRNDQGSTTSTRYNEKPRWSSKGSGEKAAAEVAAHSHSFQEWCEAWATECLRVLKPGGHMLAFGGTRTSHRLACAVEDAGFEIRDSIAWLYGSGFPKSLDVSKAIDKAAGIEREVVRRHVQAQPERLRERDSVLTNTTLGWQYDITAPATDAARTWQGWGTALKPAHEPIVVARKPLAGTVAANVLAHGTGALNVDGCRTAHNEPAGKPSTGMHGRRAGIMGETIERHRETTAASTAGRWPANVVLDESQAAALDAQSGVLHSQATNNSDRSQVRGDTDFGGAKKERVFYGLEDGGASRFFYTAKAASSERVKLDGTAHPTVKPLALMRWLVRLVTPPGGTVLEPFAGSGTTVEACILEGFACVAIEREADYLPLIRQRIHRRRDPVEAVRGSGEDAGLFDLLGEEPA